MFGLETTTHDITFYIAMLLLIASVVSYVAAIVTRKANALNIHDILDFEPSPEVNMLAEKADTIGSGLWLASLVATIIGFCIR